MRDEGSVVGKIITECMTCDPGIVMRGDMKVAVYVVRVCSLTHCHLDAKAGDSCDGSGLPN